jgi:hypothetical protein
MAHYLFLGDASFKFIGLFRRGDHITYLDVNSPEVHTVIDTVEQKLGPSQFAAYRAGMRNGCVSRRLVETAASELLRVLDVDPAQLTAVLIDWDDDHVACSHYAQLLATWSAYHLEYFGNDASYFVAA